MTAKTTVYAPVGEYSQSGAVVGDASMFSIVDGSEDDIQATIPPGLALGFPIPDNGALWRFTPQGGWKQIIAAAHFTP